MGNKVARVIVATVLAVIFAGLVAACVNTITFNNNDTVQATVVGEDVMVK